MNIKLPCLLARLSVVLAVKEVYSIIEIISTAALFTKCHGHHGDIWTFKNIGKLRPRQVRLKVTPKLFRLISSIYD